MEITKDNYGEMEGRIISEVEACDFLSFDLELTGLNPFIPNFLDSPEERYLKYKIIAERFRIIQLGIVTWKKTDNKQYEAKPFNIYVFPNEDNGNSQLNCEISAIIFNRDHGMDFNKWIRKGINYINSKQYKYLSDNLMEHSINLYNPSDSSKYKNISLYREDDKVKYTLFSMKFSEFLYSNASTFELEKPPKFFLLYILNNLQPCIINNLYIQDITLNGKAYILFKKVTEEEKKKLIEEEWKGKLSDLDKIKGVKNIFDAIIKNKKQVIGHNCMIDFLFCLSHFEEYLPNSYQEFKNFMKQSFSGVYDTKYMYSLGEQVQGITNLESIFTQLHIDNKDKVKITIPSNEGFHDFLNQNIEHFHQADYDAFVTGCAFIYMMEKLQDKTIMFNYKLNMMKTFYSCFDLLAEESIECLNCICYCLKPFEKNYEFHLEKIFQSKYYEAIQKNYYVDNCYAMMLLVQVDIAGGKDEFETELTKHQHVFTVYSLNEYKKIMKEEEEKRKTHKYIII